jgi:hypothetical protein
MLLALITVVALGCAPKTFVRSAPGWKMIELQEDLAKDYPSAWQKTVDTVARDWDIEMMDKSSGYLRTAWMYGISGGSYERYRGRITVKFPEVARAEKVEVKTEAQWLADAPLGWVTGFDTSFQRDVYQALAGRLGRTVPSE